MRVESGYFSTAGKGQAGQWDRTGKIGKEGGKKPQGRFFCLHLQDRNTSRWRRKSGQQADPVCFHNSRIGSWICIQERVCGVQVGVCGSLILMSTGRVNTGLPGIETDSGHLLPVLPLAQRRVRHSEGGPCSTLAPRDGSRCVGDHPIGFVQLVEQLLLFLLR